MSINNGSENKQTKNQVGTFSSIVEILKGIFHKRKPLEKRKLKREDILAAWITLFIVIVLGIILWFVPATNGFMRTLVPFLN